MIRQSVDYKSTALSIYAIPAQTRRHPPTGIEKETINDVPKQTLRSYFFFNYPLIGRVSLFLIQTHNMRFTLNQLSIFVLIDNNETLSLRSGQFTVCILHF